MLAGSQAAKTGEQVSVIIPVRDRAAMVAEAIASVLAQTRLPDEILVVDDGSTDGTAATVAGFGGIVRLLAASGRGPAGARNVGLAAATGAVIAFLDSDDLWPQDALARQLAALAARPDAQAAWGMGQWRVLAGGTALGAAGDGTIERIVGVNSMVFRKTALDHLGGFDPALRYAEDHDLIRRFRAAGMMMAEHEALVAVYRRHGGNMTDDREAARLGSLAAAAAALRARRASA